MKASVKDHTLIVMVAAVVVFFNLGVPRLWDRDEPRNAGCAAEMLERGDWIVPVFNAELRAHKPVLLYWLMMSAYAVLGVNEFAARFWSAVLSVGTVVLTYHIGRYLFDATAGRWAAIVLATALMFDVAARAATPDSALIFFSTLGLAGFVVATRPDHASKESPSGSQRRSRSPYGWRSWRGALCTYVPLAVAVLAKGPVGVVLPMAVIGMFLLIMRLPSRDPMAMGRLETVVGRAVWVLRPFAPLHFLRTWWSMRPLTAWIAVMAIALPWYVWVGVRTDGAWLYEFFGQHNVGRALAPLEGHDGGLLYYPLAMLVGFFPWSILTVPVLVLVGRSIRHDDRWKDGYVFCACWVGVYVALFSLAQTKLPNYVTPMYPALALLTGCFLRQWAADRRTAPLGWLRIGWVTLSVAGVAMAVGMVLAANRYLPGEQWLAAIGLIAVVGGVACWVLTEAGQRQAAASTLSVTAGLFSLSLLGIAAARADAHQQNHILLQRITSCAEVPEVAAFGRLEPSWVFYAGQPIRLIPSGRPEHALSFLQGDSQRFLITTDAEFERLRPQLPAHIQLLESVPYFLNDSQLVVIGPSPRPPWMAAPGRREFTTR